jgi:hypothetical protein
MRSAVEEQADHVGRVRAAMPAPGSEPTPQPDPLIAPVVQLVGLQSDHEPIERATSDAARKAFEAMLAYQNDTTATTDALASFEETVDTSGYHANRNRNLVDVLGITTHTSSAGAAPVVPAQQQTSYFHWENGRGGDVVSQSGFAGTLEPEVQRPAAAAPLQQGSMAAADPFGAPLTATPQRDTNARRTSPGAGKVPMAPLDNSMLPAAANTPMNSGSVSPAAAPTALSGGGADRAMPRRLGEPLMSGQWAGDAVEPVSSAKRRRAEQEEKITESVEGAGSEVPPAVIGNGPYRQ